MTARKPPETWFWPHDIKPNQIDTVVMPGTRLMRLSSYGSGTAQRFAALLYQEPGAERSYALDLDAATLAAQLQDTGARPVAITVDERTGARRFSVVLERGPGPVCSAHVDLDDAGVRTLVDDDHRIADLATYLVDGARRYAAVIEQRPGASWLFTGVTAHELDARLVELGAALVRVRAYVQGGRPMFAAVAEPARSPRWAWYADLDGDAVARNLEANRAYPVDLDATRDARGVRYTIIMVRDH